jgi:hypothetical protein
MKTQATKLSNFTGMVLISFLLFLGTTVFSQNGGQAQQKKEKIEAQKVAFMTQKLNLTPEESQKFWPVYDQYEAQKETINKTHHQQSKGYKNAELTDLQADSLITAEIQSEQSLLDLKKEYIPKFKEVLPASKVAKIPEAERQFKEMLLKLVKEQKQQNAPSPKD